MARAILVDHPPPVSFGYNVTTPGPPLVCHVLFEWPLIMIF